LPAPLAAPLARTVQAAERDILRSSAAVVAIADSFPEQYRRWRLSLPDVTVIPNWAPIDEITPRDQDNGWSRPRAQDGRIRLLYAGTLGRKHNPALLVELLRAVRERGVGAALTVVSEGQGAADVAAAAHGDPDVTIEPFQPADVLPDVLASGDVLVSLLEPEASRFSVPSKVASYLAAGRPVLLLGPSANPAADDLRQAGGMVANPDSAGVRAGADWIIDVCSDRERWADTGRRARAFAEQRYDVERIVALFEEVLRRAAVTRDPVRER
jgi:glycosyltransferase involved in cell wall biosynthesis